MSLSRRRFLTYTGATLAAVGGGGLALISARDRLRRNLLLDLVLGTGDTSALAAVGRSYLEMHPDEASRERLLALLGADSTGLLTPRRDRMDAIEQRIEADVAERRFVGISGWMLTPTEARLYALAAVP